MSIVVPAPSWALEDIVREIAEPLVEVVAEAAERARRTGRPTLAAYSAPVGTGSPLDLLATARAAGVGDLWYLERPASGEARVGAGVAASVTAGDASALLSTTARWRALADGAVSRADERLGAEAPVGAFAGFAFDPDAPASEMWSDFPGALIAVPRLLVRWTPRGAVATVAALVGPDDEPDASVGHLRRELGWLSDVINREATVGNSNAVKPTGDDGEQRRAFERLVARARERIRAGELRKVVVARGADVSAPRPIDPVVVVARLRREHPTAMVFAVQRGGAVFVGATPERMARVDGRRLETMALAGTTARGATEAEDAALAASLLASAKNREEHAIVVESVRAALDPICAVVRVADVPRLRQLSNLQHLETPIAGTLAPGRDLLDVAAALHPTPAVCGLPGEGARTFLREHEGLDRGWWAGPLGWVDARGQGELVVALRSALLRGRDAHVFAGCGIMAESDLSAEYEESRLKMRVMLRAMGGEA
jgi:isochorismate synthase